MSSPKPIFGSASEARWVLEMEKNFQGDAPLYQDIPTCVFRVPKTITETKPEAYTPTHLGLGPYNHLDFRFNAIQKLQIAELKKFLRNDPGKLQKFKEAVEFLSQCESIIRGCYSDYFDYDILTIAWILVIDSSYLLLYLHTLHYNPRHRLKDFAADILLIENQIPLEILKRVGQMTGIYDQYRSGVYLDSQIDSFCRAHSPLELNTVIKNNFTQVHLLHRMYDLIVNNCGFAELVTHEYKRYHEIGLGLVSSEDVVNAAAFLADRGVPGAAEAGNIISLVAKIPWDNILSLFKKEAPHEEQKSLVEETKIPTVSQMVEIAKIKFVLIREGIRYVKFDDQVEPKKFYLPVITLTFNSETILRNLVAFEAAYAKVGSLRLELAGYVDLMSGIIKTPKDVAILKNEKIIISELSDEDIVDIFKGISKSTEKTNEKSKIDEVITGGVNKIYDKLYRVKVARFFRKYVPRSCKFLGGLISIAVLVLLILNASCSVLHCGRWFGKTN